MKRTSILSVLFLTLLAPIGSAHAQDAVSLCIGDYQPYTRSELGEGIWAELVNAAFKSVKVTVNWQVLPSARCNEMARTGAILAAFNSLKPFEKDKDLVVFESPTLFNIDIVAFYDARKMPNGLEFATVKDLGKYRIGLLNGTGSVGVLKEAGVKFETVPSVDALVRMLDAGRLDTFLVADMVGLYNVKKYLPESADAFHYKSVYSSPVDLGFSTKYPNYQVFFDKYQEGMRNIKKDGTYLSIFAKNYGGESKINKKSLAADMK